MFPAIATAQPEKKLLFAGVPNAAPNCAQPAQFARLWAAFCTYPHANCLRPDYAAAENRRYWRQFNFGRSDQEFFRDIPFAP
jgi:hypothetical protein